eukprot:15334087-Ditylum_brightwellii.AAC.1
MHIDPASLRYHSGCHVVQYMWKYYTVVRTPKVAQCQSTAGPLERLRSSASRTATVLSIVTFKAHTSTFVPPGYLHVTYAHICTSGLLT